MSIDLRKNKDALNKALSQVVNKDDATDWAIFGYEGQTCFLKVVASGDGGIEEMTEDLSSGKMLYAYCSVKDPNTALNKFVLIHWTGESVPETVKLKYTRHLQDVQAFLKGVHVTVAARTETDIDENDIIKKVAKASGANYSFHKEKAKPEEAPAPVGTDYKRIRPDREINLNERDKFWTRTEKDEISRQKENKSRLDEERMRQDEERKERELREATDREKHIAERFKGINAQKEAERKAEGQKNQEEEKRRWAQVQKESSIDEEERGHRSDQVRKERMAEAAKLTTSSTAKSRDFFKQKSIERPEFSNRGPPPPRKIRHEFDSVEQPTQPPARKEPIQLSKAEEQPPASPEPVSQTVLEPEPEPQQKPELEPEPEPEPVQMQTARDLLRDGLPPRQDSDPEEDQEWEETTAEDYPLPEEHQPEPEYQPQPDVVQEASSPAGNEGSTDQGQCARALYDYQAADDTEISFDPDEIITNIEQIDSGWWQGFGPDGSYGMFPANYVELI